MVEHHSQYALYLFVVSVLVGCTGDSTLTPADENPPTDIVSTDISSDHPANGIYFHANKQGKVGIYKQEPDGTITDIVVNDNVQNWWPRVSPDKSTLLWYRSPTSGDLNNYSEAELWMGNPDGTGARRVIDKGQYGWSAQGVADWSPDGQELVMAVTDESGFWHIYITDNNGVNPQKVSQRNSLMADPSWSPDGEKIAYTAYPADYTGNPLNLFALEIHTMNRDGSNETRLTTDDYRDHDPYWSPDGTAIAFESQHDLLHCLIGSWAVRKVELSTGEASNIVFDEHANGVTRWSADSQSVYFPRTTCGNYSRMMRVDRSGSNMSVVIDIPETNVLDGDIVE